MHAKFCANFAQEIHEIRMEQLVARATRWSVGRFGRLFGWLVTRLTPRLLRVASSNGSANVSQQAGRQLGGQAGKLAVVTLMKRGRIREVAPGRLAALEVHSSVRCVQCNSS